MMGNNTQNALSSKTLLEPSTLFSDFANTICDARQSAMQEFYQIWNTVEGYPIQQPRKITSPRKRNTALPKIIYGRILPDINQRIIVRDAEIQTESMYRRSQKRQSNDTIESSRPLKSSKIDIEPEVLPLKSSGFLGSLSTDDKKNKHKANKFKSVKFDTNKAFTPQTPSLLPQQSSHKPIVVPASPKNSFPYLKSSALTPYFSPSFNTTNDYSPYSQIDLKAAGYVRRKIDEYELYNYYQSKKIPPSYEQSPLPFNRMRSTLCPNLFFPRRKYLESKERHNTKMKELVRHIPCFKLRKADIITDADGNKRPNPYWNEIYNPKKVLYQ